MDLKRAVNVSHLFYDRFEDWADFYWWIMMIWNYFFWVSMERILGFLRKRWYLLDFINQEDFRNARARISQMIGDGLYFFYFYLFFFFKLKALQLKKAIKCCSFGKTTNCWSIWTLKEFFTAEITKLKLKINFSVLEIGKDYTEKPGITSTRTTNSTTPKYQNVWWYKNFIKKE